MAKSKVYFVRVAHPLNTWGTYQDGVGLSIAIEGEALRRDIATAVTFLIDHPAMHQVILASEQRETVQVYTKKPEGIRLTPWPAGKPLPG